jgi:hypothetical protein
MLLSACNKDSTSTSVEVKTYEITTLITTAGYNIESLTYGNLFDYHRQEIYNKYDLDPDLYTVYEGSDNNEEDIIVVAFLTIEDANDYLDALQNDTEEDRLLYQEEYVIVLTYSQDVIDLLD